MVLNNYWKATQIIKSMVAAQYHGNTGSFDMIMPNGNAPSVKYQSDGNTGVTDFLLPNANLRGAYISVLLGSGTGTVSREDYALFNDITSSISNLSITNTYTFDNDCNKNVIVVSGTNATGSSITITEYGITKGFSAGQSGYYDQTVMFVKDLLETPITVEPSGSFSMIIEWKDQ